MKIQEKEYDLREILIKTTYQVVMHKTKDFDDFPLAYGSGFFLNYKDKLFFLTADHNIHWEDHQKKERIFEERFLGILNNISNRDELQTLISPIGGFYFMESYEFSEESLNIELVDVAISMVDRNRFEAPFVTDESIVGQDGISIVSPNELKFEFLEENIVEPNEGDTYYIYGKIRPTMKGIFLHYEGDFKINLKYVNKSGMYLLLNTEYEITNSLDWAGLSGSPVLNQQGYCIGVLCSVIEGTKSIFVKPFSLITPLLDTIILQEDNLKIE